MCGIIGYAGKKNALDIIINGLENLEYRGYDSAGLAIFSRDNNETSSSLIIEKSVGKLVALKQKIQSKHINGLSGMGHTRWATHGAPNFTNAHPHHYGRVAIVHNGILEDHHAIKQKLIEQGHVFYSDTDTEVAAHVLDSLLNEGLAPLEAISKLCDIVHGAFSFGIMIENDSRVYFAKAGSPLIVARGDGENFFASDQAALVDYQPLVYVLNDFEIGFVSDVDVEVFDLKGNAKKINWQRLSIKKEHAQKMGHKHFMHKEIFEQPATIDRVIAGRLDPILGINCDGFAINFDLITRAKKIHIVACGSAYYAGLIAKTIIEKMAGIPTEVEIASEYRYREKILVDQDTLVIAVSQSGETVDTLMAVEKALSQQAMVMSICNTLGSAIVTLCEKSAGNLYTNAGPEISVASTKAFVAQIVAFILFTMAFKKKLGRINIDEERALASEFLQLKENIKAVLLKDNMIRNLAGDLLNEGRMFYLGRGHLYPVALEGALKMKELSYIFAEGYPAGELKHGPIAIIDKGMPVVILFGSGPLNIKTANNLQEVKARGAKVISIFPKSVQSIKDESDYCFEIDDGSPLLEPILLTIPLQLLAYHLSDQKGIDVDKPRNLAKSVTVE